MNSNAYKKCLISYNTIDVNLETSVGKVQRKHFRLYTWTFFL